MIYRHDNLPSENLPEQIYNYLSNFISDLEYDSDTETMTFFDKFSFSITNDIWPTLSLHYGSNTLQWNAEAMGRERDVYFVYGEDFMQFKMYFPNYGQRWLIISYIKTADGKYFAGGSINSTTEYTLYNTPYYDVQDTVVTQYNFPKVINFSADPGKIVYAEMTPLVHSDSGIVFFDNIYSCSTVPIRSTVSIGNDNYLAVDTNNLVLLDSE